MYSFFFIILIYFFLIKYYFVAFMAKPKYLLHMHNILLSPWRDCVYICVSCVFFIYIYIYILLYIYRHICTVIHICLCISSDKIFRGNWNLHVLHGPTEHSSYAVFFFFLFFGGFFCTKFAWKREDIGEDVN